VRSSSHCLGRAPPSASGLPRALPPWRGALALAAALAAFTLQAAPAHAGPAPERVNLRRMKLEHGVLRAPGHGGASVKLTIDPALQRAAQALLVKSRAHEGAIVMSDVRTGKVLVWASRGGSVDNVSAPVAPSASLFKVVTAAALLESGKVTRATRQCYAGGEGRIEREDLHDDRSRDNRCTTMGDALGHSVNLVFARLAIKHLTPESLRGEAEQLGIGSDIPADVRVPRSAVKIPSDELGMARAAAGFWNGKLSPLSALFLMQTIANQGERVELSIIDDDHATPRSAGRALKPGTARALTRMLEVTTRTGTSAKVFRREDGTRVLNVRVAGKTGTLVGGKPVRWYSWFAGFAPSRHPQVAISVLLANDVKWWAKGNEIAREMLEAYFARKPAPG
jgi:penicillin-binding protein A